MKDKNEFDLKRVVSRFLDYWKLYVICIISFIVLGFLFINYSTPLYTVRGELVIQDDQGKNSSFAPGSSAMESFSGLFDIKSNIYNELVILQTKDLLKKVVQSLHLDVAYFKQKGIRDIELYDKSPYYVTFIPSSDSVKTTVLNIKFEKTAGAGKINIESDELDTSFSARFDDTITTNIGKLYFTKTGNLFEKADYQTVIKSVRSVSNDILSELTIELSNPQTTVINLSYNTNVPKKGEDIVNTLITEYTNRNINEKNLISDSSIAFINARMQIVSQDLNNIEQRIQNFKQNNKIADLNEQSRLLVDNTYTSMQDLNQVNVDLEIAKNMLSYVMDEKNNTRPVPVLLTADPTFLNLVQTYNNLLIQRDRISLSISESNPIAVNIQGQIKNARANIIKSLESRISALEVSKKQIETQNSLVAGKVTDVPVQERQYENLSREQSMKQALYLYLLQKKEETAITKASNLSNASVIETPQSSSQPYFPNPILVYAISMFLGLAFPTSIVALKLMLNSRISSSEDIKEITDCPIVAEIGHSNSGSLLSIKDGGRSLLAEQFRIFRSNMNFIVSQKKCPILLFTSSMSGEGKSFISANIGQIYAISGKRVLIIEMDLRKPHVSKIFNRENGVGLTNYIISDNDYIEDYIQEVPNVQNVSLLSSGPIPPNPAELLMSPKIPALLKELKTRYDLIILDCPPIGLVTDAQIVSEFADACLFVVRERYTFKNSLELLQGLKENRKFENIYIVVNDVLKGASYKYGYGYGYGYGYYGNGNGYYHEGEKTKKSSLKKILSKTTNFFS